MFQDDPVVASTRDERTSIKTTHLSISTYLSPITATTATTHCKTGSIGGKPLRVGEAPEPSAPGTPIGCWNRSPQSKSIHIISSFWWTTTSIIDHPPVFQAQLKGSQGRLVDREDAWWSLTNLNAMMHPVLQIALSRTSRNIVVSNQAPHVSLPSMMQKCMNPAHGASPVLWRMLTPSRHQNKNFVRALVPTLFIRARNYDLAPWVTFKSGQGPKGPSSVGCQTTLTAGYSFARQRVCKVKSVGASERRGWRGYATGRFVEQTKSRCGGVRPPYRWSRWCGRLLFRTPWREGTQGSIPLYGITDTSGYACMTEEQQEKLSSL
ncbi:MAG: hypothetical protein J3Q66DRAFT_393493 [Benniella sp.]|nr:MAG: hypothetical protein J3Q66DRAFT_393493 [Benniella sp.]